MLLLVGIFTFKAIRESDCLKVNTFKSGNGWGYEIVCRDRILIHQKLVPGIAGNYCFETKTDAKKVGALVIKKIRSKEIPAISEEDLRLLNVDFQPYTPN